MRTRCFPLKNRLFQAAKSQYAKVTDPNTFLMPQYNVNITQLNRYLKDYSKPTEEMRLNWQKEVEYYRQLPDTKQEKKRLKLDEIPRKEISNEIAIPNETEWIEEFDKIEGSKEWIISRLCKLKPSKHFEQRFEQKLKRYIQDKIQFETGFKYNSFELTEEQINHYEQMILEEMPIYPANKKQSLSEFVQDMKQNGVKPSYKAFQYLLTISSEQETLKIIEYILRKRLIMYPLWLSMINACIKHQQVPIVDLMFNYTHKHNAPSYSGHSKYDLYDHIWQDQGILVSPIPLTSEIVRQVYLMYEKRNNGSKMLETVNVWEEINK